MMLMVLASNMVFVGCTEDEKEPPSLEPIVLDLYKGENATLTYKGGKCTWSSDEPAIASVSNTGIVTGNLVGSTQIHANKFSCCVTVYPKYNTYEEPYISWGSSINTVDAVNDNKNERLQYDKKGLIYKGKGNANSYIYLFENEKLSSSAVLIDISHMEEVIEFLSERYIPIGSDDTNSFSFTFIDYKKTMGISLNLYSVKYLQIVYFPLN